MSENVNKNSEGRKVGWNGSLVGQIRRTLDSKNRLTISAGCRQLMGNPDYVYLAPGLKGGSIRCVDILPPDVFDDYLEKCRGLPGNHERKRALEVICGAAAQVSIDSQGRVRLIDKFLEFAGVKGDVVMSGAYDRIKVWADDGSDGVEKIDLSAFEEAREELRF